LFFLQTNTLSSFCSNNFVYYVYMIKTIGFVKSTNSSNIIKNGDFSYPVLDTNNIFYFTNMSSLTDEFKNSFGWGFTQSDIINNPNEITLEIINGNDLIPQINPYLIGVNQYMLIRNRFYQTTLYQTINIPQIGKYKLSFYYCKRESYYFNSLNIYLNDDLFDAIDEPTTLDWVFYTKTFDVNNLNDLNISFTGTYNNDNAYFIIANVSIANEGTTSKQLLKVFPTDFSTQVTTQTHHKITNAGLNENTKKMDRGD